MREGMSSVQSPCNSVLCNKMFKFIYKNHKNIQNLENKFNPANHLDVGLIFKRHFNRFCIIGSGPAGFYAAQHLLKLQPSSHVDIFEKLPVPFGLVRYGVAPDHPEVKNVINTFTGVLKNPNVQFIGNFEAEKDTTLDKLKESYHAIVLAYGASEDRKLGVEGEKEFVVSAREFVGWYNGLPENRNLQVNFEDKRRAIIIGQGNVALDIARILLSPIELLDKTDISPYALEALKKSKIAEVVICGRRGPLQVSFTIKELRELVNLQNVRTVSDIKDFQGIDEQFLKDLPRPKKRLTDLMLKTAQATRTETYSKSWFLKFMRSPKKIEKVGDKLHLTLEVNEFKDSEKVVGTGRTEVDICDVVFRSVGYKGRRIFLELPFDESVGLIPNVGGKIEDGIYCCGWAGQGPRGVITSTMQNSFDVAKSVIHHVENSPSSEKSGFDNFKDTIKNKRLTSKADFAKIADFEAKHNRKVTSIDEMFAIINGKLL